MLSAQTIAVVKSTVPLLESAGTAITEHFYQRMFNHNPELKNIFNMTNQRNGRQQFALFSAIAAYAKNIDNPAVLSETVERIAHKHTSYAIEPAHYDIVGHHLIETLRELAPDAFTQEVEQAWTEAYGVLANIFIGREEQLYSQTEQAEGGWRGTRKFSVIDKTIESELVTSFILAPVDEMPVVGYQPGQYLAVKINPEDSEYAEIRQYSLSDKANGKTYRISVKRENNDVAGLVSNYLHDHIEVGDSLDVLPPAGDFFLRTSGQPTVLISAGVGLTPMMSMLEALSESPSSGEIYFLHACENMAQHSFAERVGFLTEHNPNLKSFSWYNNDASSRGHNSYNGLMNLSDVSQQLPLKYGNFYLCGPREFMHFAKQQLQALGVNNQQIHYEVFGPHSDL